MRIVVLLLVATASSLLGVDSGAYQQRSIGKGVRFISPDGRYSVELQEIDRLTRYVIKDTKTDSIDGSIIMPSLLLYLHWAPDSRSIVAVEHIPHGSCGRAIYRTGNGWADVEVRPPGTELKDSAVVELKIGSAYAHYQFAVRYLRENGMPSGYAFCDLDVKLEAGAILNVRYLPVSQAEWAARLERQPSYTPAMVQ
jgi:hypothetical protein